MIVCKRPPTTDSPDRRTFLKSVGAGMASLAAGRTVVRTAQAARPRLGLDMYSVGIQNWTPFQQMDFAAARSVKMVHFSEIRFLGSPDWKVALAPDNLRRIRARADALGLDVEIGMRSICPTSTLFDPAGGSAEEQLSRMVDAATIMRSPVVRCVLGSQADRRGPIEKHIDTTVAVLKRVRSKVIDAGVKVAIENHAGDMQARELKALIEAAGPEFVGACIDSGNAVWTIEDPHLTLETLVPYVLTSHVRDSYVFTSPQGTAVQWSRMGEGNVGIDDYIRTYVAKCPGKAVSLEVIVSNTPRLFNYRDPQAWELFRTTPAHEFARFLALCDKGVPRPLPPPATTRGPGTPPATGSASSPQGRGQASAPSDAQRRNLEDVETSLQWTRSLLATLG